MPVLHESHTVLRRQWSISPASVIGHRPEFIYHIRGGTTWNVALAIWGTGNPLYYIFVLLNLVERDK